MTDNKPPQKIKIFLYLEFIGNFKNIGTGIYTSYKNQKNILQALGISVIENWDNAFDILQSNTIWLKSVYLIKKAKKQGKKVIVWSHVTVEDGMAVFRFFPAIAPIMKRYYRYAYGLADMVFCPTEYTKALLADYGLPKEKLVVMSNAVDLNKFYADPQQRTSGRTKFGLKTLTVGTVGQVQPRKGIDTFLNLAKKFPQNQFLWIGNFFSKLIVKGLPKNLPKNVRFTGYVNDILEAFNSLDIFIFPSYEENQGMVILEAAALGLPILVRDIPAYQGWLIHGENCLKAKNQEEFEKCLKLLADDETLRNKLSRNAKILAQQESLEAVGKKLLQEYQKLLK